MRDWGSNPPPATKKSITCTLVQCSKHPISPRIPQSPLEWNSASLTAILFQLPHSPFEQHPIKQAVVTEFVRKPRVAQACRLDWQADGPQADQSDFRHPLSISCEIWLQVHSNELCAVGSISSGNQSETQHGSANRPPFTNRKAGC